MLKKYYILVFFLIAAYNIKAADIEIKTDSINIDSVFVRKNTSTIMLEKEPKKIVAFKPDAEKAVWFSALLPGFGQIYNRQYWKVPIIYGGAIGLGYSIAVNNQQYIEYRKAYADLARNDGKSTYYEHFLPEGVVINDENRSYYTNVFKSKQDAYLNYRDISIIGAVVLYLLTIIDAYVDAQLFDYDISPDLSLQLAPAILPSESVYDQNNSFGLKARINF